MEKILLFYSENQTFINFIKDCVYVVGVWSLIRYLLNWNYVRKTTQIDSNLKFRKRIESALDDYVIDTHRNGRKDVGIRFVHWKNYPWFLKDDGYKNFLYIKYLDKRILGSSWIDNTGIYFYEILWFTSTSVYVDERGRFFFDSKGKDYKGFAEYKNKCLVMHLPFSNIINFDFREVIEHEPVFYIKYKYTKYKKLYSNQYVIREKFGDEYLRLELDNRKQISKYFLPYYKMRKKCKKEFSSLEIR